jgi:hypothetical protein
MHQHSLVHQATTYHKLHPANEHLGTWSCNGEYMCNTNTKMQPDHNCLSCCQALTVFRHLPGVPPSQPATASPCLQARSQAPSQHHLAQPPRQSCSATACPHEGPAGPCGGPQSWSLLQARCAEGAHAASSAMGCGSLSRKRLQDICIHLQPHGWS